MPTTLDLGGLDKRMQQISSLKNLDARPLMIAWTRIIEEDNRRGVLAGLDKDGVPMAPVTYRPKEELTTKGVGLRVAKGNRIASIAGGRGLGHHAKEIAKAINVRHKATIKETLAQFRRGQKISKRGGAFGGIGSHEAGTNNNLSTAEYQLLGGPPLAPRDQFSRVITNLQPVEPRIPSAAHPYWEAACLWDEIVDTKGRPFLRYHFEGIGQKKRDLRGVRPQGIQKALDALRNWARDVIHTHFST